MLEGVKAQKKTRKWQKLSEGLRAAIKEAKASTKVDDWTVV